MWKNGTPLWREAPLQFKMLKNLHCWSTFGSCDVEKWHAAVARSTFASQNAKKTDIPGAFLEVRMSKNCTPLWREAHVQVKMYNTPQLRSFFGRWAVENLHAAVARSTFPSQNAKNMRCSGHFLTRGCREMVQKLHAGVAPSTCASQTVQNTCFLRHF